MSETFWEKVKAEIGGLREIGVEGGRGGGGGGGGETEHL